MFWRKKLCWVVIPIYFIFFAKWERGSLPLWCGLIDSTSRDNNEWYYVYHMGLAGTIARTTLLWVLRQGLLPSSHTSCCNPQIWLKTLLASLGLLHEGHVIIFSKNLWVYLGKNKMFHALFYLEHMKDFNIEKWIRPNNGSSICRPMACEGVRALEHFSF